MAEEKKNAVHNVILEGREKLSVSGVGDVDSFDESMVEIYTEMGMMEVKGADLHISKLNLESGEFTVEGRVDSVVYADKAEQKEKSGLFGRWFR